MHDRKRKQNRIVWPVIILFVMVLSVAGCGCKDPDAVDYSKEENWAYFAEGTDKPADLFLICPTVDMGVNGNFNMSMEDEETKANFLGALNMERGIYEEETSMYAPYYRQITFPVYSMSESEMNRYLDTAYEDVENAFHYYMEHCNEGRPVVLAGFSQGSQLLVRLLEEEYDNPDYQNQLIAAYCIGWRVTDDDLKKYPHLSMAQGEDDTGVIVSFNTEAEGVKDSLLVPRGVKTNGINPLNWRTDSTAASKEENLGACFTNYEGTVEKEVPHLTGARLSEERGTLIATDIQPEEYSNGLFPDGVYHLNDYLFFYRNLQENVKTRTEAFLSADN